MPGREHDPPIGSPLAGTPLQLAGLLRQGGMTVDELAAALGLTGNAVRAHLARLERDGIVMRTGMRRGVSRPAVEYGITPDAELVFSRAYAPVLAQLLRALAQQLRPDELDALLRDVGRALVSGRSAATGALRERAEAASALFNGLGGASQVETADGALLIRGFGCPLAAVSREHPEVCNAVESLLSAFIAVPVTTCCDRAERMRCCFLIGPSAPARRGRRSAVRAPRH
ncbi:MAG: helix-turn-helix transcriptional regulator [Gemmatimonadaceae bacterium]